MLQLYTYKACSTCKDAVKWLQQHSIPFNEKAIRETPPSQPELQAMLEAKAGQMRPLFNTSGLDYRAQGLSTTLDSMSQAEALQLLGSNGNLVKRPFAIDSAKGVHLVGFKAAEWDATLRA